MAGCSNCAKPYSLFNRERACPKCGFGFCSNCLQNKIILTETGKDATVCRACYKACTEPSSQRRAPASPLSFLQRGLDHLEKPPASNPITVYKDNEKMKNLKKGLTEEDRQIADRLEQLQRDRKAHEKIPSDQEMAERLAKLKDLPTEDPSGQGAAFSPSIPRSDAVQTDDLLKQMSEEIAIDGRRRQDPAEDISARLTKLRGLSIEEKPKPASVAVDEELPSDEEANNIVQRIMDEQRIESEIPAREQCADDLEDMDEPPPLNKQMVGLVRQLTRELREDEEFPWCTICNEDASLRCKDCDEELYCKRCFVECHSEFEMDHKSEPYILKQK